MTNRSAPRGRKKPAPDRRSERRSKVSAPLVLLVDDYEDNRLIYSEYLAFAGYRVAEAVDGHEAISKAVKLLPDAIVMDLSLPGIDGYEATRAIRADERTQHVPIIALTGFAMSDHADRAREVGFDGFLTKPCLPSDLLKMLERRLADRRAS